MPQIARPAQTTQTNTTYNGRPITVAEAALKRTPRIPVAGSKVRTSVKAKPSRGIAWPLA